MCVVDRHSEWCVYRKLDSAILVMKPAKERLGCDEAETLNRPMERGILVQRAMNARFIIICGIPTQDPAQVRLPEYDQAGRAADFTTARSQNRT